MPIGAGTKPLLHVLPVRIPNDALLSFEAARVGKGRAVGAAQRWRLCFCRAVPCVHAGEAQRIAANIAKLPELWDVRRGTVLPSQATSGHGNSEGSCVKMILQ